MLDLWWKRTTPDDEGWCEQRDHWLDALPRQWDKRFSQLWRRQLLADYLGCAPDKTRFSVGDHGKPALVDSSLHFSVSHSHDWHLLLVSDAPCGVDIEPWNRPLDNLLRPAVLKRFAEFERLKVASSADFLRCWTMKEAWAKTRGCSVWDVIGQPLDAWAKGYRVPGMTSGYITTDHAGGLASQVCVAWAATGSDVCPRVRQS